MAIPPSIPFPKAIPVIRGCGERSPGGLYVECGLSPVGRPFDDFLVDPPLPLLPGLDAASLANKPRFVRDPTDGTPHLVIWIGAEHYPYVSDYVEEARRFGISRKLSPSVLRQKEAADLSLASRMLFVHPHVINVRWQSQRPPYRCKKRVLGHALDLSAEGETAIGDGEHAPSARRVTDEARVTITEVTPIPSEISEASKTSKTSDARAQDAPAITHAGAGGSQSALALSAAPTAPFPWMPVPLQGHTGPCLFKIWELLPPSAAVVQTDQRDGLPLIDPITRAPRRNGFQLGWRKYYLRRIGSTEYIYAPTEELPEGPSGIEGLEPGIFGAFPITGFALVKRADGAINQDAGRMLAELWDRAGVPWYEADR